MTEAHPIHTYGLYIDGAWAPSSDGAQETLYSPASGDIVAHVARATQEDVDRAVAAARHSFEIGSWSNVAPTERARVLEAIADLLEEHTDQLAVLETLNGGATVRKS